MTQIRSNSRLISGDFYRWKIVLALSILHNLLAPALLSGQTSGSESSPVLLTLALEEVARQFEVSFAYDATSLEGLRSPHIKASPTNLRNTLDALLAPHRLTYEIVDGQYVMIKTLSTPLTQLKPLLCGRVKSAETGKALPAATIGFAGSGRGIYAEKDGSFQLYQLPTGIDSLTIRFLGYQKITIPITDLTGQPCRDLYLHPAQILIPDVLVEKPAIRLLRSASAGDGWQFRPDRMPVLPGWGDNDPLRMAQLLPGIHTTDESAANLHIRGGTPDQNLVLWENIPIYHTGHFFGLFSAFDPFAAASIDVYKGGYGTRYGGRVSGVIDIRSKPISIDSFAAGLSTNLINLQGYLRAPIEAGKSAIWISGRRSFTDIVQSKTYQNLFNQVASQSRINENAEEFNHEELEILLDPQFHFDDLNFKWAGRPSEQDQFDLSLHWGNDFLDYRVLLDQYGFFLDSRDLLKLKSGGGSARWRRQFNSNHDLDASLVYSGLENNYDLEATWKGEELFDYRRSQSNRLEEMEIQVLNKWQFRPGHYLTTGIESHRMDFGLRFEVENRNNADRHSFKGQLRSSIHYWLADYSYIRKQEIELNVGWRHAYHDRFSRWFWEPRFSFDYFLTPHLKLKMAAGRNFQFVSQIVEFNDLGLGEELWILASEELGSPPMSAVEYSIGLNRQAGESLVDLELYHKKIDNLTSLQIRTDPDENLPTAVGSADIKGFDLLLKQKWSHYESWFSYSFGIVDYVFADLNNGRPFSASHEQKHTINWTHFFRWKAWEISLSWNFNTGRPYTPATGVGTEWSEEKRRFFPVVNRGPRNSGRLPDYRRVDLSVHHHFKIEQHTCRAGLAVFNLFDHENIFDRDFILPETNPSPETPYLELDRTMIGFTPNIFLRFDW